MSDPYTRGFYHGAFATIALLAFLVLYVAVGGAP